MKRAILGLILDESGQDLVEYALVSSGVAVGTLVFVVLVAAFMNAAYGSWQTAVLARWEPCNPAPAVCP
jgi:Flp pilus assembly pilin Flp